MKKAVLVVIMFMLFAGMVSAASINGDYNGKPIVKVKSDGKELTVDDAPAVIMDGRTMVPIYMLSQLGITVTWDQKTNSVDVTIPGNVSTSPEISPVVIIPMASDVIKSKIESDFDGFDYENIYELSNGQYWKQVDYTYEYEYEYRPDVLIYKEGSYYYMDVENCEKHPRIELIE